MDEITREGEVLAEAGAANGTLKDRLRRRREGLRQERHWDYPIPGYGGELIGRFRPVTWGQLQEIAERRAKSKAAEAALFSHADTLIKGLESFYLLPGGEGEVPDVPQAENCLFPGQPDPIQFGDPRLAEYLGFEAETARQAVVAVFVDKLQVTKAWDLFTDWMDEVVDKEVGEELVGE